MAKQFVTLNEQDFTRWADQYFGTDTYQITQPKFGRELVIRHDLNIHGIEIHIYTTIEPGIDETRSKGEDAIRIILFDRWAGKIVHQESKILRVTGDTTVFERLSIRVDNLKNLATDMQQKDLFCKCTTQRAHTVKRTNSRDGSTFYGCSLFGKCNKVPFDKVQNARNQYPLKFNPFEEKVTAFAQNIQSYSVESTPTAIPTTTPTKFHYWDIDEAKECATTNTWKYVKYPFEKFNVVQTVVLESEVWKRDVNLILGTATSSGKTLCAEMALAYIFSKK